MSTGDGVGRDEREARAPPVKRPSPGGAAMPAALPGDELALNKVYRL
jgi:hypothetical protein